MGINADKPGLWKTDVEESIDFYNDWFMRFAPATYREQRDKKTKEVSDALRKTDNLRSITPEGLKKNPGVLPMLRMTTAPPIARDRLIGLAYVNKNLVESMEGKEEHDPRIPPRMPKDELEEQLTRICEVIYELADRDLFAWLDSNNQPTKQELDRAATVVADRLCGAASDPIIRNAQERRQLSSLRKWLSSRGYRFVHSSEIAGFSLLEPGSFTFRLNVPAGKTSKEVNIPIDCVVQPFASKKGGLPTLIEAKSAGDATNTNKRRKEEAQKFSQLKQRYGADISFVLLLCGYFEPGYLGYEAAEGIDSVDPNFQSRGTAEARMP